MKILAALTLIGPLMLAISASAQPALTSNPPVRLAAVSEASADRDSYTRKAHDEVEDWQKKLHEFNVKADAVGKEADRTAKADLDEAWRKTKTASRQLQIASAKGWDVAKADYEKASRDLADTWHRNHPDHS
jgi:Skp family chaperone for outer membrane proteins